MANSYRYDEHWGMVQRIDDDTDTFYGATYGVDDDGVIHLDDEDNELEVPILLTRYDLLRMLVRTFTK
jgi:hypothetical protein